MLFRLHLLPLLVAFMLEGGWLQCSLTLPPPPHLSEDIDPLCRVVVGSPLLLEPSQYDISEGGSNVVEVVEGVVV